MAYGRRFSRFEENKRELVDASIGPLAYDQSPGVVMYALRISVYH